jgi:glucuronate isomerase
MPGFIHEDFLLETDTARALYHDVAKHQPILDYHCHLPPEQIAENHRFSSLTEAWLGGDHYKWRAMRTAGVSERFITGEASDWEKFQAWAQTVPKTLRNPLYHWTHLELDYPFEIRDTLLDETTAESIYARCNEKLADESFGAYGLLVKFNVRAVCTTDDPTDCLEHHRALRDRNEGGPKLFPTWRPDKAIAVDDPVAYNAWLGKLSEVSLTDVTSLKSLLDALSWRHAFFHEMGCRPSDPGLDVMFAVDTTHEEAEQAFQKVRGGNKLNGLEAVRLKSVLLHEFALMDHEKGWVQQFHLGALRNNNARLLGRLGPDTGFDSIGDDAQARPLARFLDRLDKSDQLAKTILYNLNPADNELMATMIGNFQDGSVPGKMQYGSAWWFLDQLEGMERQMNALSNMGLLYFFVGMLTDSRSFLSYSRHQYFRRLLCNMLGNDVKRGLVPDDRALLGELVKRVCYDNARAYFALGLE